MADLTSIVDNTGLASIPMGVANPMAQASQQISLQNLMNQSDVLSNAAKSSDLQTSDMLATRKALADNTSVDPTTGQVAVDYPGTLKALAATNPTAALNFQQAQQERIATIQEKQASLQATRLANAQGTMNLAASVGQSIITASDPQKALDNFHIVAQQDPNTWGAIAQVVPQTYDPNTFKSLIAEGEKASDFINQKIEVNRLGLQATKQNADIMQMANSATNEVAGQYKDDPSTKDYVATANTYASFKAMQQTPNFAQGLKDRDLVYNFQNIINPGRSATGGTTEQDEEARSILQGWGVDVNKINGGDQLSPAQRQQISSFVDNKYQQATLKQQAVFNQYQNRLVHMAAQGQPVDPYHALPTYGNVQQNVPKGAVDNTQDVVPDAGGIQIDGTAPPAVDASILTPGAGNPAAGYANPTPPPATAFAQPTGPVISRASIDARAERTGENPAEIVAKIRAKGGRVEGE